MSRDAPIATPLRVGTRGSRLARIQAALVRHALAAAFPGLGEYGAIEEEVIRTSGDAVQDRPLADLGGKGLFAKEIDEALLAGRIDLAVHSLKDLETRLAAGIALAAVLARADPRDALVLGPALKPVGGTGLGALPQGARVGTSSLRRKAQLLNARPDLAVVLLRGNVETRLRKLAEGAADATLLALAGLDRLGLTETADRVLDPGELLPAVGQGVIGICCRADDSDRLRLLAAINHAETMTAVAAERAMLAVLDGSCRTPIAGHAELAGGRLRLRGLVASPDGRRLVRAEREGEAARAAEIGQAVGTELRRLAGPGLLAE
ncbi:MAG: hydroxymethylbilane synthase [Proteobacteria bacterium]|nr:hydroxymethylbilane synthase [Pseudomonadota bacterium]